MIVRELLTKLGIQVDTAKVDAFNLRVDQLKKDLSSLHLGFIGLGGGAIATGLYALAQNTAKVAGEAKRGAAALGVTTQQYQELSYAAKLSSVDTRVLMMSLGRLSSYMQRAKAGGKAGALMKSLGIDPKTMTTADQALEALADRYKAMPTDLKTIDAAKQLFGARNWNRMAGFLKKGGASIRELKKEAQEMGIVLDDEAITAAGEYTKSMRRMSAVTEGLKLQIGAALLPVVADIASKITGWVIANKKFIKVKIVEYAKALAAELKKVVRFVVEAYGRLDPLIQKMGGVEGVVKRLVIVFGLFKAAQITMTLFQIGQAFGVMAASALAASGPVAALGAALNSPLAAVIGFAVIALAIEDIYRWVQGDPSLIGDFVQQFQDKEGFVGSIATGLAGLLATVRELRGQTDRKFTVHLEADYGERDWVQAAMHGLDVLQDKFYQFEVWLVARLRQLNTIMREAILLPLNGIADVVEKIAGHKTKFRGKVEHDVRLATDLAYRVQKGVVRGVMEPTRAVVSGGGLFGGPAPFNEGFSRDVQAKTDAMQGIAPVQNVTIPKIEVVVPPASNPAEAGNYVEEAVAKALQKSYFGTKLNYAAGVR